VNSYAAFFFSPRQAHLDKSELALDHTIRMLYLGTNPSLEFLGLVDQCVSLVLFIERFALARSHGHVPGDDGLCVWALVDSLVPGIAKGIHANVRLHAKVHLLALDA